jgi:PAS domain S-box-containing protein/putative nucleotidyltransferase with HDIG domain
MGDLMKDDEKTKRQLVIELTDLRSQCAALEKSITENKSAKLVALEVTRYAESIVETVREPLLVLDANLKIISANRNFYATFKVNPANTIGRFIHDLGNKQWNIPKLRELLENILPKKEVFNGFEVEHTFQNIGHKIMLLNARQIYRADINSKIILLAIEDITERRLIEEKLILAAIVESSKDAIIGKSLDGIITSWNKGAEEIYGYTKSEIIGKSISVLVPPEMPDELTDILSKIKLGEAIESYETVRQRKDGQNIYVSLTISAIHDAEGRILGASTIARDITERKQLEKLLRDSEEQYRLLFETANDGILLIEKNEGKIVHINPSVEKMLGYSAREVIGNKLQDVGLIIDNGDFQITMKNLNKRGILRYDDVPVKTKSGQHIYTDTYLVDKAKFAQCNIRDITERKRAVETLKESEKKYRLLADNVHDVIFVLDMNLNYTYVSPSVKFLRGYEPEELINQPSSKTLTPSSWDLTMKTVAEVLELEKTEHREINISRTLQLEMMRKDGTTVWTEVKFSLIRDEYQQPVGIMGVTRNITERKQAEEQLQKTLDSLKNAVGVTIHALVSAIESRDPYTAGHQIRVANLARAIATEMELHPDKIEGIRMAGSIHDIGKLSIPAEILSKPTKLTNIEFSLIKEHSLIGYEMLKDVESPWPLAQIVYQHHERMNGSGYPRNLKGDEILMEARIMAVADVVEAMASHRPYRAALGIEVALEEIEKNKGIFYDNAVADTCLRLFREKGYQLT